MQKSGQDAERHLWISFVGGDRCALHIEGAAKVHVLEASEDSEAMGAPYAKHKIIT